MFHIGNLSNDTEVYLEPDLTQEGDRLFEIIRWADKEHTNSSRMQLTGQELEKLHRLIKQWRRK